MKVSVVIPTYRRSALLTRCLLALGSQDLRANDFEILVCDDAGIEETRALVEALTSRIEARLRYFAVPGPRHGPAVARNIGWRHAEAPWIAFTDDDTIPDPRWLSLALARLEANPEAIAACGGLEMPIPERPTDYERDASGLVSAEFVTANCFVRKDALGRVGGYDERFRLAWREDSDLHFRLLPLGPLIPVPEAKVVHPIRPAPWGVSVGQQRKAIFNALLYKKHPRLYVQRIQSRPPLRYYAILLSELIGVCAATLGMKWLAIPAGAISLLLTLQLVRDRLRGNSLSPKHVGEMLVTSILIPPLAIFWRLAGAWKFRVLFF